MGKGRQESFPEVQSNIDIHSAIKELKEDPEFVE